MADGPSRPESPGGLALLFPGQASQAVGMGADLRQASRRAADLFALADRVTGLPITRLCEEGPLEALTATEVAQVAVVVTSLAALAVLAERLPEATCAAAVAGHSVGEVAACVAAGVLDDEAALRLVHVRARAMSEACARVDGTMAAVLGLEEGVLRQACAAASRECDGSVEVANLNAPGQLVVSGARDAVARVAISARAAGARRVVPLTVGGPFHSAYMRAAAEPLAAALASAPVRPARVPVVASATGEPIRDPADLRAELAVQVYSPVRWISTLHGLAELGCDRFLEVGPGQVVAGLARRTLPSARVASFGSLADLERAASLVRGATQGEGERVQTRTASGT